MLGAVVGDIIGSVYEGGCSDDRNGPLFDSSATVTDDSVCTVAVAEATLASVPYASALKKWGKEFINAGFGREFRHWLSSNNDAAYGSWGNGALMRVSPAIALASTFEQARQQARTATIVTHDHPVALESVEAYTRALWTALEGANVAAVCATLQEAGVRPHSVETAHRKHEFHSRSDETLADVLSCLQTADSFESLMRECVYHGGDSDTICAVAGPLGELLWGIPTDVIETAWRFVPASMQEVLMDEYEALARIHPDRWSIPDL